MALMWPDTGLVLLVVCFLACQRASADCLPEPIDIPIRNITFPHYNNNVIRGLEISLGSPAQPFAFLPQTPLNNSFVYWTENGFCGSLSNNACATFRGGLYDNTSSSSIGTAAVNSHPPTGAGYPTCQWVTDEMTLASNTTIQDYPFGIVQKDWGEQAYHPQSSLGVGSNSSILSTLKNAGHIASRSWSMFWGLQGATEDAQMDGTFVMGGYDRAKTTGKNFTQNFIYSNTNCGTGMLLTITDMSLNFPNGSSKSMFGGVDSAAMTTCIDPDYPVLMSIPYDPYYMSYQEVTGDFTQDRAFGVDYYGMLYEGKDAQNLYKGDLTITFSNTFSVRIRNDQLIVPELTIEKTSGALNANASSPELLFNSLQSGNSNDMARIGRQFFSGAYILVNHDANEYTLWAANATAEQNLVIVDENGNERSSPCTSSTASASASTSATASSQGISSGGIAGAVVGSVAGTAVIAGAVFFLIWRKRKAALAKAAADQAALAGSHGSSGPASDKGPIDLTPRLAQELPGGSPDVPHELPTNTAPQELPGGSYFIPHELPGKPVAPRAELE